MTDYGGVVVTPHSLACRNERRRTGDGGFLGEGDRLLELAGAGRNDYRQPQKLDGFPQRLRTTDCELSERSEIVPQAAGPAGNMLRISKLESCKQRRSCSNAFRRHTDAL